MMLSESRVQTKVNKSSFCLETAFQKVKCIPRQEALKKVVKSKTSDREPFCVTYHPSLPSVAQTVRNHHKVMVDQSEVLKRCFDQPSIIAYKKSKSLGDILIRAKISTKRKSNRNKNGFYHCKRLCILCITSNPASVHTCYHTKQQWQIKAPINCVTSNVIYKLSCKRCPSFVYIGETKRRLCERIQEHRGAITQKKMDHPVGAHFNQVGLRHSVTDLIPLAIERVVPKHDTALRKRREHFWINNYMATSLGANRRD